MKILSSMMETYKLLLSGTRALRDAVTPNLRQLSIREEDEMITVFFYYDKAPSELEEDLSECVATEVIADFTEPYGINCKRIVVGYPERINAIGYLIYSRYEPDPSSP